MNRSRCDIDASLARHLVAAQFPQWADLAVRAVDPGGWDNRTFRLGEDMSVRLPSAERYAAQVAKEQAWLPRLASHLPLPIPTPLAMGDPSSDYPWHWSVYRWIEGEPAAIERIADLCRFAVDLAQFLNALQRIDPDGGPPAGAHNFHRGGPLAVYDGETRDALSALGGEIDATAATAVWEAALRATWHGPSVWVHGDVSTGNLLVREGRLSAVVDFGSSGVGDPACDTVIAWTLFSGASREAFRAALPLDDATWARGRGWALWKALITVAESFRTAPARAREARRVIEHVLADHVHAG
ncbi:MAG: aminoglycoside phosphotransferase family protein [Anaerolineae bacterium]|nr:aminoglycoside phosphotransferase family protein [Anaerolineae bacterium]